MCPANSEIRHCRGAKNSVTDGVWSNNNAHVAPDSSNLDYRDDFLNAPSQLQLADLEIAHAEVTHGDA
jgi:hypothetical protein